MNSSWRYYWIHTGALLLVWRSSLRRRGLMHLGHTIGTLAQWGSWLGMDLSIALYSRPPINHNPNPWELIHNKASGHISIIATSDRSGVSMYDIAIISGHIVLWHASVRWCLIIMLPPALAGSWWSGLVYWLRRMIACVSESIAYHPCPITISSLQVVVVLYGGLTNPKVDYINYMDDKAWIA